MQYPDGYLEAQEAAAKDKKRPHEDTEDEISSPTKKRKKNAYKLDAKIKDAILSDNDNEKLWNECKSLFEEGKQAFLNKVEELFRCICCQEIVYMPVSTECKHNICKVSTVKPILCSFI